MDAKQDYSGKHKIVLPADYMNSIDAVCDLYEDRISEIATNLDCAGLKLTVTQRLIRFASAGLVIWLIPVIWLTCL